MSYWKLNQQQGSRSRSTIDEVYRELKIQPLNDRRKYADLLFFYKVVNAIIDSPEALAEFRFVRGRPGLRKNRLVETSTTYKNYVLYGPKNRLSLNVNEYCMDINFFGNVQEEFKRNIKRVVFVDE